MRTVLLDTSAYAGLLAGSEAVLEALAEAETVIMSTIVLGELYAGFKGGRREQENNRLLEEFLRRSTVRTLDVSKETAEIFGTVRNTLKTAGTPIPLNDVWISAHALEVGAWMITFDRHFSRVPGLLLWQGFITS